MNTTYLKCIYIADGFMLENMDHNLPKFSMVMPLRDTPRERTFAKKSILSALALKPDELVVGVDAPAADSLIAHIKKIVADQKCVIHMNDGGGGGDEEHSRDDISSVRIVHTPVSKEWGFHLSHVMWNCYTQCSNDVILTFYNDSVLRRDVLKGLRYVGKDNNAVVSLTPKLLIRNLSDLTRYVFYRYSVRRSPCPTTGLYWIYRPFYFEDMDEALYKKIRNGMDTYMYERIRTLGRHNILALKDMGSVSMDYENSDYPWRQFQIGVWYFANYDSMRKEKRAARRGLRRSRPYRFMSAFIDRHPYLSLAKYAFIYQHPWSLRGFKWAERHTEHEAVRAARGVTLNIYSCTGVYHIKNVYDWKSMGQRVSTGLG